MFGAFASVATAQSTLHTFPGLAANDRFGAAVAGGMDLDLDGRPDLLVGAYAASPTAPSQGTVRVISGSSGSRSTPSKAPVRTGSVSRSRSWAT